MMQEKNILEFLRLNESRLSKEALLEALVDCGCLLHGSRKDFKGPIKPTGEFSYFTDTPWVAILKAIYSNENCNLSYPIRKSDEPYLEIRPSARKLFRGGYI
jgi:hypothetical protein